MDERNVDKVNAYECQKCNLTFSDRTSYVQHHLSYHEMSAKRRRTGKFGEPVVGKDGMFECPICHKTFEEESRYFGHVGAHARYEGLTPEAFLDRATSRRETNTSLAEISFSLQELTEPSGQNNKVSGGEAGFQFQHLNHSNEHGDSNSTVTELFGTNCSDNFIRPDKAWSRTEGGPSFNVDPSVCRYTNFTGHADVTVPERASNSNNQSVSNINGFAGVAIFNDQSGSHVVRPTFGTANHYQDQIIVHGMSAPKHADDNIVKTRDVNLNSCVNTISFPIAKANNETSVALNEATRSSSTAKILSGSFSNNDDGASSCSGLTNKIASSLGTASKTEAVVSRCFGASYEHYGDDSGALKANPFSSKNNTTVYQSNLGTQPVYAVPTRADGFASGSMQTKNSDKELTSNTKERIDSVKSRTSKEAGFVTDAYNEDVFSGGIAEKGFAQFSNSFTHMKPNASGHCSLPESKTPTAGNVIKGNGSDINCMKGSSVNRGDVSFTKGSFVNRPINNNEPSVARLEVMGKLNNEMQNRYNDRAPGFDSEAAASASRNANGLMPIQANFGSMSSAVQSVADVSMTSTSQDQVNLLDVGFLSSCAPFSNYLNTFKGPVEHDGIIPT